MPLKICSLCSGSSGNSTIIAGERTKILIDCGISARAEECALYNVGVDPYSISGIFITHEHSDHIKGAGIMSRKYNIPIYANEGTWSAMHGKIGEVRPSCIRVIRTGTEAYIDELCVDCFSVPHDACEPVGYCINMGAKKVSIVTDLGVMTSGVLNAVQGSQLVILEANHDKDMLFSCRYPVSIKNRIAGTKGHLSNADSAAAIMKLMSSRMKYVLLGHLSKESNTPEIAFQTVKSILESNGVYIGSDVMVDMTYRDKSTHVYNLI